MIDECKNRFKIKVYSENDVLTVLKLYSGYLKFDCKLYKDEYYYYTNTSEEILKKSGILEII